MTTVINQQKQSFIQEDASLSKYRLAVAGTGAKDVKAAVGATAPIIGVTDESANAVAADPVGLVMSGTAKVSMSATCAKGASITATTAGQGVATTTDTNEIVGIALEACTVADQVIEVQLQQGRFVG